MDAYNFVLPFYIAPERHYHDIRHINGMLVAVHTHGRKFISGGAIDEELYYAIVFHDTVYNFTKTDMVPFSNEILSAFEFENWDANFGPCKPETISNVMNMIMATEHHFDSTIYADEKTNLLLDLDLLSFTSEYELFKNIQIDIDNEYFPYYDRDVVIEKRHAFLKNIYDTKSLKYRVIDPNGDLTKIAYQNIEKYLTEKKVINV